MQKGCRFFVLLVSLLFFLKKTKPFSWGIIHCWKAYSLHFLNFEYVCEISFKSLNLKKCGFYFQMSNRNFRQIYFYEFKLGRIAAQTARNINEVWGQGSVNECTVQRWFQKFRAGNTSLEDEPHGSRPPTLG